MHGWIAAACIAATGCGRFGFGVSPDGNGATSDVATSDGPMSDGPTIDTIDGAVLLDASCAVSGTSMTMLGARTGGTGQASMADTFVIDTPNRMLNYGAAPTLGLCNVCSASGAPWDGSVSIALLRFDVTPICSGSTIQAVSLLLDTTSDNLGAGAVGVFVVKQAWEEGTGAATGVSAAANWTDRMTGVQWTNAGVAPPASRDASAVATFSPVNTNTAYSITIAPSVVQGWLDAPATNFGLALVITSGNSDVQFHSRSAASIAQRPGLLVTALAP